MKQTADRIPDKSMKSRWLRVFLILPLLASAQQPAPTGSVAGAGLHRHSHVHGQRTARPGTSDVKDKSGKPVEGLKKEDFTVTEDGKPQTIKFFDYENLDEVAATPVLQTERLPEPVALPKLTRTEIAPEPPGTVQYKDRRLLALYFDMNSMAILDQLHALDAARSFVRKQMNPADMMAIMQYNGTGVEVLQDFTGDKEKLLTIIATLVAGEADNTGEANADASAADTGAAFGQDDSEFNIFNTDRQLAALQTATKMLGTLNEKKSLIYFASGMQLNGVDNQAQLTRHH